MRQKLFNFAAAHFAWMAFMVKQDVPSHPLNIGLFGAIGNSASREARRTIVPAISAV
jgi:hypothetical protein